MRLSPVWISASLTGLVAAVPASVPQLDISATLQNILANTDNSPSYTYPTDLTRGIIPVCNYSLSNLAVRLTKPGITESNPFPQ